MKRIRKLRADRYVTKLSTKSHIYPKGKWKGTTAEYVELFCRLNHLTR